MADSVLQASVAETENKDELTLPSKRKVDPLPISRGKEREEEHLPNKAQRLQSLTHSVISAPNEEKTTENPPVEPSSISNSSIFEEKHVSKSQAEENDVGEAEEDDGEEDDVDYEDDEDEENGEAATVDRKGKGILVEEENDDDDDDDDDSSDGGSEVDGDGSELEDDPLAEVDLDNILPSRTRRRAVQPGVYIANDTGNNEHDDSDDSDA